MSHLFLSYARADALDLAQRLYTDLADAGYTVWQDKRDIDPNRSFDYELEQAILNASAVIVCLTADVARENSFVRKEIAQAKEVNQRIIPLKCPGGHVPITLKTDTYIDFADYEAAFPEILARLQRSDVPAAPGTRQDQERHYLQAVAHQYERWFYLYTDLAGRVQHMYHPGVKIKPQVLKYLNTQNAVYRERGFVEGGEADTVDAVDQLREVVKRGRVVLLGEPGSGKTTTLQRLAYEFAIEAMAALESGQLPTLPVFVPLGAYESGGLEPYIQAQLADLPLTDYLPERAVILLDGLNEMPSAHTDDVQQWLQQNPAVKGVVTCRRLDYANLGALPLRRVDVLPLDVTRIRQFIGTVLEDEDRDRLFWALAGEELTAVWQAFRQAGLPFEDFWSGKPLESGHPAYQHTSDTLDAAYNTMCAALRERNELPGLLELASNPFLLTIIRDLFIERGQPPENRGQLFRAFVTDLIEQRGSRVRPGTPAIEPDKQVAALAALAYRMQQAGTGTSVSITWAMQVLTDLAYVEDADNLLYRVESATLLTIDRRVGELKFTHQLLQEYFAALRLSELIDAGLTAAHFWPQGWWTRSGWEETVIQLAGMRPGVAAWLGLTHPVLALRALTEGMRDSTQTNAVRQITLQVMTGDAPPVARAEVGRLLNRIGDTRPGVGLRADRLPDIHWADEIEAGPFLYGDAKEKRRIDYPYAVSRYPITNAQFQAFVDDPQGYNHRDWWTGAGWDWKGERRGPDEHNDPGFRLPNHARIFVRWYEAVAFCHWLTQRYRAAGLLDEGEVIRLPTEEEWEQAARGTDGRVYPWGDVWDAARCNNSVAQPAIGQTSAVGIFPAGDSPCRASDMAGNVWEWCLTNYETGENTLKGRDVRVLRGGAWLYGNSDYFRAAYRFRLNPFFRNYFLGFRVARSSYSDF